MTVICLGSDPRQYGLTANLADYDGKDVLIVAPEPRSPKCSRGSGPQFDTIAQLPPVLLRHAGRPAMLVPLFIGHDLHALPPENRNPSLTSGAPPRRRAAEHRVSGAAMSAFLTALIAVAGGAVVANLYYAQPLIALIGPAIGLGPSATSLIVTVTQVGYTVGLVLLVPLGDIVENRRLIAATLALAVLGLGLMAVGHSPALFLGAALIVGVGCVTAQMLIALTAHLAPEATRGQVVGNVMSGLLAGILLSRPAASMIADLFGWRAVFGAAAIGSAVLIALLARLLPERRPASGPNYGQLIASLPVLLARTPVLRRRGAYQATLFAAFSLFWTAAPLELARLGYTQRGIALFALAGAAGALAAPIAGRLADRGWGAGDDRDFARHGRVLVSGRESRRVAGDRGAGRGGGPARFRCAELPRHRAARHLHAACASAQPPDRPVHRAVFPGRRGRVGLRQPRIRGGGWPLVTWIGFALPLPALLASRPNPAAHTDTHRSSSMMLTWAATTRHMPSGPRTQLCICRPTLPGAVSR